MHDRTAVLEKKRIAMAQYERDRSICTCGHEGDQGQSGAFPSGHTGMFGHGKCMHCLCRKFSWQKFTDAFAALLARITD